jgi:hypothetical protein
MVLFNASLLIEVFVWEGSLVHFVELNNSKNRFLQLSRLTNTLFHGISEFFRVSVMVRKFEMNNAFLLITGIHW